MYAAIRKGKVKPETVEELSQKIRDMAVPILEGMPGYRGYYAVFGEDDTVTTISLFEDRDAAEASNAQMVNWVRENLGQYLAGPPEAVAGEVIVHS